MKMMRRSAYKITLKKTAALALSLVYLQVNVVFAANGMSRAPDFGFQVSRFVRGLFLTHATAHIARSSIVVFHDDSLQRELLENQKEMQPQNTQQGGASQSSIQPGKRLTGQEAQSVYSQLDLSGFSPDQKEFILKLDPITAKEVDIFQEKATNKITIRITTPTGVAVFEKTDNSKNQFALLNFTKPADKTPEPAEKNRDAKPDAAPGPRPVEQPDAAKLTEGAPDQKTKPLSPADRIRKASDPVMVTQDLRKMGYGGRTQDILKNSVTINPDKSVSFKTTQGLQYTIKQTPGGNYEVTRKNTTGTVVKEQEYDDTGKKTGVWTFPPAASLTMKGNHITDFDASRGAILYDGQRAITQSRRQTNHGGDTSVNNNTRMLMGKANQVVLRSNGLDTVIAKNADDKIEVQSIRATVDGKLIAVRTKDGDLRYLGTALKTAGDQKIQTLKDAQVIINAKTGDVNVEARAVITAKGDSWSPNMKKGLPASRRNARRLEFTCKWTLIKTSPMLRPVRMPKFLLCCKAIN